MKIREENMVLVYLLIRAEHGKTGIVKSALTKFEEISEIHEIFGRYDIIAKVEFEYMEDFSGFMQNKIRIQQGIKSVEPVFSTE